MAIIARRLRVPYTVALVAVGLQITFGREMQIALSLDLTLALFVPPLVFEAAFVLRVRELRENLVPILVLAVLGVILTTVIVGLRVGGESLFNDGTAIAVFTVPLTAGVSGQFDPVAGTVELLTVAIVGAVIGLGGIVAWVFGRGGDSVIETVLPTVLAFGVVISI